MARKLPGTAIVANTITTTQLVQTIVVNANAAYDQANSAYGQANAAYSAANNAINSGGASFSWFYS